MIRNPKSRIEPLHSRQAKPLDIVLDETYARHMFPQAEGLLVKRLAMANAKRRQLLEYRAKHQAKLAEDCNNIFRPADQMPDSVNKYAPSLSETVASQFLKPPPIPKLTEEEERIETQSETTYSADSSRASLPTVRIPEGAENGRQFWCQYCSTPQTLRPHNLRRDWTYVTIL